jgi:L-cysteine:1D-myo-inositol 2-amino-2-deoxy-alpha-D-glucopyranoside ligase
VHSWPEPDVPRLPGRGGPLRVRDSSSGELREVGGPDEARMYVCGITPYDATHVGHAATYVTFDVLQRVWRDAGLRVRYVQNVTDVDDPLLERAAQTGEDWETLAERETAGFRDDMAALRVIPPERYVGATEAIPDIAVLVHDLLERGAAYDLDGDTYFSVASAPHFGDVARLGMPEMLALSAERGGDPDRPGKKDPLDPLLWQAARPGEPAWDSPLGPGRPGWHIECAAIALDLLGPTIDVQGGGSDLAFPHHELGAAEASVVTGSWPFAHTFVHQGMVGYQGEKMSKSRGNLVFVARMRADGVDPMALRLALLAHHYATPWEWTDADLATARERLARWRAGVGRASGPPGELVLAEVRAALSDDLRTPDALAAVDRWASSEGDDGDAPATVRTLADALLGVAL